MLSLQDCFRFWVHYTHRRLEGSRLKKLCHICCNDEKVFLQKKYLITLTTKQFYDQKEGQKSYNLYSDQLEPTFLFQVNNQIKGWMNHQFIPFFFQLKGLCGVALTWRRGLHLLPFVGRGSRFRFWSENWSSFCSWTHNLPFIASFHTVSKWTQPWKNRSYRNVFLFNQCFYQCLIPSVSAKTSGAQFTCKANLQSFKVLEKDQRMMKHLKHSRGTWSVSGTWASDESFYTFVKTRITWIGDKSTVAK